MSNDGVAARLAAAEVLTQLREVDVPPEFAGYLELYSMAAETNASRGAVAALPAGAEREAAELDLDGVLAQEEQTERHLLDQVDWLVRLAFSRQLGILGDICCQTCNAGWQRNIAQLHAHKTPVLLHPDVAPGASLQSLRKSYLVAATASGSDSPTRAICGSSWRRYDWRLYATARITRPPFKSG